MFRLILQPEGPFPSYQVSSLLATSCPEVFPAFRSVESPVRSSYSTVRSTAALALCNAHESIPEDKFHYSFGPPVVIRERREGILAGRLWLDLAIYGGGFHPRPRHRPWRWAERAAWRVLSQEMEQCRQEKSRKWSGDTMWQVSLHSHKLMFNNVVTKRKLTCHPA
jgi:hypothetical protein